MKKFKRVDKAVRGDLDRITAEDAAFRARIHEEFYDSAARPSRPASWHRLARALSACSCTLLVLVLGIFLFKNYTVTDPPAKVYEGVNQVSLATDLTAVNNATQYSDVHADRASMELNNMWLVRDILYNEDLYYMLTIKDSAQLFDMSVVLKTNMEYKYDFLFTEETANTLIHGFPSQFSLESMRREEGGEGCTTYKVRLRINTPSEIYYIQYTEYSADSSPCGFKSVIESIIG